MNQRKQANLVGAISAAMAMGMSTPAIMKALAMRERPQVPALSPADQERIARAEAKQARKHAARQAQRNSQRRP